MIPVDNLFSTAYRAELLDEALDRAWRAICRKYEVSAPLPDLQELLTGANFTHLEQAASYVFAQMLLDAIEEIGRFSPWYRLPERAFGLVAMRDPVTSRIYRILAPEAASQWQPELEHLAEALDCNSGLIQAMLLVNRLISEAPAAEPYRNVQCGCQPPRIIQVKPSVLENTRIICTDCLEPFR